MCTCVGKRGGGSRHTYNNSPLYAINAPTCSMQRRKACSGACCCPCASSRSGARRSVYTSVHASNICFALGLWGLREKKEKGHHDRHPSTVDLYAPWAMWGRVLGSSMAATLKHTCATSSIALLRFRFEGIEDEISYHTFSRGCINRPFPDEPTNPPQRTHRPGPAAAR